MLPTPANSRISSPLLKPQDISDGLIQAFDFNINSPPTDRPVRIYCDGIYDLFHFGHAKALEQAKKSFHHVHLIVGVCNDEETLKRKGLTVMTASERYEAVRHCKWVDQVVQDAPWIVTQSFLDSHNIDYVAHDAEPYQSAESGDVYAFVKAQGKFLPTSRTDGVSTSDLITRIIRDYDSYIKRNLDRGSTAKELNISSLKEKQIKTQHNMQRIKRLIYEQVEIWETSSHQIVTMFAGLFGIDQVVQHFLENRKLMNNTNSNDTER